MHANFPQSRALQRDRKQHTAMQHACQKKPAAETDVTSTPETAAMRGEYLSFQPTQTGFCPFVDSVPRLPSQTPHAYFLPCRHDSPVSTRCAPCVAAGAAPQHNPRATPPAALESLAKPHRPSPAKMQRRCNHGGMALPLRIARSLAPTSGLTTPPVSYHAPARSPQSSICMTHLKSKTLSSLFAKIPKRPS